MKTMFLKLGLVLLVCATVCSADSAATINELYDAAYQQGIEYVRQGELERAKEKFREALIYKPDDAEAQKGIRKCNERLAAQAGHQSIYHTESYTARVRKREKDRKVRLIVGVVPAADTYEYDSGDEVSLSGGGGGIFEVLVMTRVWTHTYPNFGWVYGGGMFVAYHSGDMEYYDLSVTAFGATLQGGVAYRLGDAVVLEVTPFVGVGSAYRKASGGFVDASDYTDYYRYGVKSGIFYQLNETSELGLEAGYSAFYTGDSDAEISGDGGYGGIVFSHFF